MAKSASVTRLNPKDDQAFRHEDGGTAKHMSRSFYRGDTINFNPYRDDFTSPTFLEDYILKGWLPPAPPLTPQSKITAFGSCFATHITAHLSAIGYDLSKDRDQGIYISRMGEGLVNTFAILGQFEWALEGKKQPEDLWHGFKAEGYGYDEDIRLRTRDVFLATDFFIITLGLSEIWYDEVTDGVFWRAVPEDAFDAKRHKFRVSTVGETKANLAEMYRLIKKHVPEAKVLFTLSPISLAATFRPVSCVTANSVSKAILRAGLDEFLRSKPEVLNRDLFYFPSYEILQQAFLYPWRDDGRHPHRYVLETIMRTFEAAYCTTDFTLAHANRRLQAARAENLADIKGEPPAPAAEPEKTPEDRKRAKQMRKARKAARQVEKAGQTEDAV